MADTLISHTVTEDEITDVWKTERGCTIIVNRPILTEEERAKCFEYMSQDPAVVNPETETEIVENDTEENIIVEAAETTNEAGVETVVEENAKEELDGAENNDSEVK